MSFTLPGMTGANFARSRTALTGYFLGPSCFVIAGTECATHPGTGDPVTRVALADVGTSSAQQKALLGARGKGSIRTAWRVSRGRAYPRPRFTQPIRS